MRAEQVYRQSLQMAHFSRIVAISLISLSMTVLQTSVVFAQPPSFITVVEPSATKQIPNPVSFHCTSGPILTGGGQGRVRDRLSLTSPVLWHRSGMSQRLLRRQVPLRGLDRGMAEEQLDLL
jgi:hypothetical protein